jgi:integrase
MKGNITRRGPSSWRLKFDAGRDPGTGKRDTRFVTVRGTKKQAQVELTRILAAIDSGSLVDPSAITVAQYLRGWIDTAETLTVSGKTAERYRQLIERQIIPHLGSHQLQKLKAAHIANWHAKLFEGPTDEKPKVEGVKEPRPLAARTVGHAHRVLRKALQDAMTRELTTRNPAALVSPPTVVSEEMEMLSAAQVTTVLAAARQKSFYPHLVLLLATGMRRGELMGLQWGDVDLDQSSLRIERAVEKTKKHGLRIKSPKTKHGRRRLSLPSAAVSTLRDHRKAQLEIRLVLGIGKIPDTAFVFGDHMGNVRDPDWLTKAWGRLVASASLPEVTLHALRHSHASALIAAGTDPVTVSRRLGHGSPTVTMAVYAHLFHRGDESAVKAADALFGN